VDGLRAAMEPIARRRGTTVAALEAEEKERIKRQGLSSASSATLRSRMVQLWVVACALVHNASALIVNALPTSVTRQSAAWEFRSLAPPPNLAGLLQVLLDVHGFEIFQLGVFNGDPHPGNIMFMPDGRLGLIDYGSCVTLSEAHRRKLARLMLALSRAGCEETVRVYSQEMGVKTKNMNADILYRMAAFWYDRDTPDVTDNMNVHSFMEWLHEQVCSCALKLDASYRPFIGTQGWCLNIE